MTTRWTIGVRKDCRAVRERIVRANRPEPNGADRTDVALERAMLASAERHWTELLERLDSRDAASALAARLASQAMTAVGELGMLARLPGPGSDEARDRLADIALFAHETADGRELTLANAAAEPSLGELVAAFRHYVASVASALVAAIAVAVLLVSGRPAIAAAVLAARVAADLTGGLRRRQRPNDLFQSTVREAPLSFRMRFAGCALSHIGDLVTWSGFVVAAELGGHHRVALVWCALVGVALFGTLLRLGIGLIGLPADRSAPERWVRVGGLLAGCLATATFGLVTGGFVAVVPAAGYAIVEGTRAVRRAAQQRATDVATLVRHSPDTVGDEQATGVTVSVVNAPCPSLRRG